MSASAPVIAHLLQGLRIGGMERGTLQLAMRGLRVGQDHRLILFDLPPQITNDQFPSGPVPVLYVPRSAGIDYGFPLRLAAVLRRWKVNILHTRNDTALFYGALAVQLVHPRPALIATFHTYPSHPTTAARITTCWASRLAQAVTAVSNELRDRLLSERWLSRCRTIWNGVDIEQFSPAGARHGLREQLGRPAGELLIGHVGRLDPIKRHMDLIEAARILTARSDMPPFHIICIGNGPSQSKLQAAAAHCSNVSVVPSIRDVPPVLRELDLLLLCSAHEGTPRIILEAMAVETPVIATEVGGIPDMLMSSNGRAGYLVPAGNPEALAEAILRAAVFPNERAAQAILAKQQVRCRFTADQEWTAYNALYQGLLTH